MDLSDPVALALVAVGVGAYLSRRVPLAVVMMTLAALVRESTLAIPVVLMAAELVLAFRRHRGEAPWRRRVVTRLALLVIPLAVYALLQVWVSGRYSGTGFEQSGSANVTAPLLTFIRDPGLLVPRDSFAILRLVALGALVALFVVGIVEMLRWARDDAGSSTREEHLWFVGLLGAIGGALLVSMQARVLIFHYRNFTRAASEFEYLVFLALAVRFGALNRWSKAICIGVVAVGVALLMWSVKAATPLPG